MTPEYHLEIEEIAANYEAAGWTAERHDSAVLLTRPSPLSSPFDSHAAADTALWTSIATGALWGVRWVCAVLIVWTVLLVGCALVQGFWRCVMSEELER